jgi:hypothetical protein
MRSEWGDGDACWRALAWGLVVVVHAVLLWWLARPVERESLHEPDALQIHWTERPKALLPAVTQDHFANVAKDVMNVPVPPADLPRKPAATTPAPVTPAFEAAGRSMSAVFLEQGRRWAEDAAPIGDFQQEPLAAPEDLVALPKADRFRMRTQVTPERMAQAVGVLFGGAGYTTDPCPRVRRNLARLGTGNERELVDEEVRRLQRLCQ